MAGPVRKREVRTVSAPEAAEAKVFMTGRSQAVRLPKQYRVSGESVYVKRLGEGILLLPKTADRWKSLFTALDEFPRDFKLARDQGQRKRRGLEGLFREERE